MPIVNLNPSACLSSLGILYFLSPIYHCSPTRTTQFSQAVHLSFPQMYCKYPTCRISWHPFLCLTCPLFRRPNYPPIPENRVSSGPHLISIMHFHCFIWVSVFHLNQSCFLYCFRSLVNCCNRNYFCRIYIVLKPSQPLWGHFLYTWSGLGPRDLQLGIEIAGYHSFPRVRQTGSQGWW